MDCLSCYKTIFFRRTERSFFVHNTTPYIHPRPDFDWTRQFRFNRLVIKIFYHTLTPLLHHSFLYLSYLTQGDLGRNDLPNLTETTQGRNDPGLKRRRAETTQGRNDPGPRQPFTGIPFDSGIYQRTIKTLQSSSPWSTMAAMTSNFLPAISADRTSDFMRPDWLTEELTTGVTMIKFTVPNLC